MATARLIPSTYYRSSSYLTVSGATNMYANTDSSTYGTVQNTRSSTSSYYIYLRGFNFDDVPSNAVVSGITIKLKAYHSGGNTSTIYGYNGTTQVSEAGSTTALTTSATVKTFSNTTIAWDTLKSYGSNFGIRINCRRKDKNTASYIYIYGAEILVTYTVPTNAVFLKVNGSWQEAEPYKMVNGTWTAISDLTTLFDSDKIYRSGRTYTTSDGNYTTTSSTLGYMVFDS